MRIVLLKSRENCTIFSYASNALVSFVSWFGYFYYVDKNNELILLLFYDCDNPVEFVPYLSKKYITTISLVAL